MLGFYKISRDQYTRLQKSPNISLYEYFINDILVYNNEHYIFRQVAILLTTKNGYGGNEDVLLLQKVDVNGEMELYLSHLGFTKENFLTLKEYRTSRLKDLLF